MQNHNKISIDREDLTKPVFVYFFHFYCFVLLCFDLFRKEVFDVPSNVSSVLKVVSGGSPTVSKRWNLSDKFFFLSSVKGSHGTSRGAEHYPSPHAVRVEGSYQLSESYGNHQRGR